MMGMDREIKEKTVELIGLLLDADPDDFEEMKAVMPSFVKNPACVRFLAKVFELVEERRPKMIEMKC